MRRVLTEPGKKNYNQSEQRSKSTTLQLQNLLILEEVKARHGRQKHRFFSTGQF